MTIPKRAFCYTRVSTDQQNTKAQEVELKDYVQRRGWVLKKIYTDKISGMKDMRPGLNGLMADCRKKPLRIVVVIRNLKYGGHHFHPSVAVEKSQHERVVEIVRRLVLQAKPGILRP
jgi:predicted site-specific integrase-resolvase